MLNQRDLVVNETIIEVENGTDIVLNLTLPGFEFALDTKEARMTQILGSWMVKEAWDGLDGVDGDMTFGGFKNFLEQNEMRTKSPTVSPTPTNMAETRGTSGTARNTMSMLIYSMATSIILYVFA